MAGASRWRIGHHAGRGTELMQHELQRKVEPGLIAYRGTAPPVHGRGGPVLHYNCGVGASGPQDCGRRSISAAGRDVRRSSRKWRMGGGKVLPGLVRRRKAEADLFMEGVRLMRTRRARTTTAGGRLPSSARHKRASHEDVQDVDALAGFIRHRGLAFYVRVVMGAVAGLQRGPELRQALTGRENASPRISTACSGALEDRIKAGGALGCGAQRECHRPVRCHNRTPPGVD